MKFNRASKKNKCPICRHPDWCGTSSDGKFAVCMRVESDKPSQNGGWTHVLIEDENPRKTPVKNLAPAALPKSVEAIAKTRSAEDLNEIYSAFLKPLILARDHQSDLKRRGLDIYDQTLHGYKSMPSPLFSKAVCRELAKDHDLRHVPGFYYRNFTWHFVDYFNATGFLIPIRNAEHKIVGLQLRRDDGAKPKYMMISSADKPRGASSGAPPHFAYLGIVGAPSSFREIIVTEGALKANIIATYADEPTVGLVGVGCFDEGFAKLLTDAFPNLETVRVAFDMDAATNPAVRQQRKRLQMTLEKIKLKVRLLSWDARFKGFDDFLVSNFKQQKIAA